MPNLKRLTLLAIIVALVCVTLIAPVAAQDKTTCDPSAVLKSVAAIKSSGDARADLAALLTLRDQITAADVACNGLTFKGKGGKLVGPFMLPAGNYKATLTMTAHYASAKIIGIAPQYCVVDDISTDKPETLVMTEKECKVTVEMNPYNDTSAPWTITLEPLS